MKVLPLDYPSASRSAQPKATGPVSDLDNRGTKVSYGDPLATIVVFLLPLGLAFALIALGELGDKTQLLVVSLAARYSRWAVLVGAIVAEVAMAALAVAAGQLLVSYVPIVWFSIASGLVFMAMGIPLLLRRDRGEGADLLANLGHRGVMLSTLGLIALGELGDKTQLFIVALTVQYAAPVEVFVGAVLGEVLMMVIGVFVGDELSRRLPRRRLRVASGAIFLLVGALVILGTLLPFLF